LEILDFLVRLDCGHDSTYARFEEIRDNYLALKEQLPSADFDAKAREKLLKPDKSIAKNDKRPWDTFFRTKYFNEESTRSAMLQDLRSLLANIKSVKEIRG